MSNVPIPTTTVTTTTDSQLTFCPTPTISTPSVSTQPPLSSPVPYHGSPNVPVPSITTGPIFSKVDQQLLKEAQGILNISPRSFHDVITNPQKQKRTLRKSLFHKSDNTYPRAQRGSSSDPVLSHATASSSPTKDSSPSDDDFDLLHDQNVQFIQDEEREENERDLRIALKNRNDTEQRLRPVFPGSVYGVDFQTPQPSRENVIEAYKNVTLKRFQSYLRSLDNWAQFIRQFPDVYTDPTLPVLDILGNALTLTSCHPDRLLLATSNQQYLKDLNAQLAGTKSANTNKPITTSKDTAKKSVPPPAKTPTAPNQPPASPQPGPSAPGGGGQPPGGDPSGGGGGPDKGNKDKDNNGDDSDTSPNVTPPDSPMAGLRDKAVFFPSATFDGTDKSLARSHWQAFSDFATQQNMTAMKDISPFFQMTLRGLAREWFVKLKAEDTLGSKEDLKNAFLQEFNEFGKTSQDWLHVFSKLKFDIDNDDLDAFVLKFSRLTELLKYPPEYKLDVFKMAMPQNVRIQLRGINNFEDAVTAAKEIIQIINADKQLISNQIAAMSIEERKPQSRSPSPRRRQSPSLQYTANNGPPRSRSRQRQRPNYLRNNQFGQNLFPNRSASRYRPQFQFRPRSRSMGRGRPRQPLYPPRQPFLTCYKCGRVGHTSYTCRSYFRTYNYSQRGRGYNNNNNNNNNNRQNRNFRNRRGRPMSTQQQQQQVRFNNQDSFYNYPPQDDDSLNQMGNQGAPM